MNEKYFIKLNYIFQKINQLKSISFFVNKLIKIFYKFANFQI